MRIHTLTVRLSAPELSTLRARSAAHRLTMAAYVRLAALGGDDGPEVRDANTWWASLSGSRRASVHHWLADPDRTAGPGPGQQHLDYDDTAAARR